MSRLEVQPASLFTQVLNMLTSTPSVLQAVSQTYLQLFGEMEEPFLKRSTRKMCSLEVFLQPGKKEC